MTKTFEIGKTYLSHFLGDHELHTAYTVVKRTDKRITLVDEYGKTYTKAFYVYGDKEKIKVGDGEFLSAN